MDAWHDYIPPSHKVLYKPLPRVENGGCEVYIWEPRETTDEPAPVALFIHGGGFIAGTAEWIPFNQVAYFLERGIAVVSVAYRLLPHVRQAEVYADCLDAYRYLQANVHKDLEARNSSLKLAGDRIAALGWSAGGHLVIALAKLVLDARRLGEDLPPLRAIVPSYAVTEGSFHTGTLADFDKVWAAQPDVKKAFETVMEGDCLTGFTPVSPDTPYTEARRLNEEEGSPWANQPMTPRRVWLAGVSSTNALFAYFVNHDPPFPKSTQPINFVTPDFPPTCVFVACSDEIVPVNNSYDLAEKTRAAGVETLVVEAKDMPHGHAECLPWVRWPEGYDWWQEAIEPSLEFVIEKIDRV